MKTNRFADSISQNIKKYRQINNLTQEQMASQLFLDTQYYAQLERGERNFTIEKIILACQIFHIGIEKIIIVETSDKEENKLLISSITEQLQDLNRNQLLLVDKFIQKLLPYMS